MGLPKTVALLAEARSLNNTDMRHWYVIMSALFLRAGRDVPLRLCDSVEECLVKNAPILQGSEKKLNVYENMMYQAVLLGGQELLQVWETPYASTVYSEQNVFPTFDTTVFSFDVSVPNDSVMSVGGLAYFYLPPKIQVLVQTYQLANVRVVISFEGSPAAAPTTQGMCITTANAFAFLTELVIMLLTAARDEGLEGVIQRAIQNLSLSVKRDSARLPDQVIALPIGSVIGFLAELAAVGFGPLLSIRTLDISKMGQTLNIVLTCDKNWGYGYSFFIKVLAYFLKGVSYSTRSVNDDLFQIAMIVTLKETETPCTEVEKLRKMNAPVQAIERQKSACTQYVANMVNIGIGWLTQTLFKMRTANMPTSVVAHFVHTNTSMFFVKPMDFVRETQKGLRVNVTSAMQIAAENTAKRIRKNVKSAVKAYEKTSDKVTLLQEMAKYITLDPFEIMASLVLPDDLAFAAIEARKANTALLNRVL